MSPRSDSLARAACLLAVALATAFAPASAQDTTTTPPQRGGGGADPSDDAFEMGSPPRLAEGLTEEEMWPAATAEGWEKPVLVHWQRSFDDALKVARAEQRPILVCVNMDGEIASEHWAGVRYRDAETAALLSRYACVIASVYRHTPRDYDEEGRRVECPRFETVTCGEHIQAERELYDRYFDGRRISPRHIVLDLEEKETLDVYFSWDTASVVTTFVKGVEGWPDPIEPSEPTLVDLARSADVEDREELERTYVEGTRETRRELLTLLVERRAVDQVEVLRAAIFGLDLELAKLARRALAQCDTDGALDLMAEALKVPLEESERRLLLDAVERLAPGNKRARTLAALHGGLSVSSRHIEPRRSAEDLAAEYEANAARTVDVQARAETAEERPEDPRALLELAEAMLARAVAPEEAGGRRFAELLAEDALAAAREAERLGARGARLDAAFALASDRLGQEREARARAVAAVEGGLLGASDEPGALEVGDDPELPARSRTRLLQLFADARVRAIREAYRAGGEWPPEWLSDVNAAYTELAAVPETDDETLAGYHDFLRWIGATPRANDVLDQALARFPESALLHDRLRGRLLWEGGPDGLERGYAQRLAQVDVPDDGSTQLVWFAGYASLVAAEHHRRRNKLEEAVAAYGRAVERFETSATHFPEGRDSCLHYVALAHAGRARVALEQGDLAGATDALLLAFETRPDSAASLDGLGLTPVMTAKMLEARLAELGDQLNAERVHDALEALDPRLLEPPPSERFGSGGRRRRGPPPEGR